MYTVAYKFNILVAFIFEYMFHSFILLLRDSSVAVIVYDITNRASFLNTSKWIEDVRNERGNTISNNRCFLHICNVSSYYLR